MKILIVAILLLGGVVFLNERILAQTTNHNAVYRKLLNKPYPGGMNEAWEYASKIPEWDLKKMRGFCMFIDSKEVESTFHEPWIFRWQTKLLAAARVDVLKDSKEIVAEKVRKMWNANEELFICNNIKFDVANGSAIKFAANLKFDEFMIWMAHWKVNLNKIDETDGRTLLDYLREHVRLNKGLPQEPVVVGYYDMIRKAGGRHRSEL